MPGAPKSRGGRRPSFCGLGGDPVQQGKRSARPQRLLLVLHNGTADTTQQSETHMILPEQNLPVASLPQPFSTELRGAWAVLSFIPQPSCEAGLVESGVTGPGSPGEWPAWATALCTSRGLPPFLEPL